MENLEEQVRGLIPTCIKAIQTAVNEAMGRGVIDWAAVNDALIILKGLDHDLNKAGKGVKERKTIDVVLEANKVLGNLLNTYDFLGQNTYLLWTVGERGKDAQPWEFKLDSILQEKGCEKGEEVVLLIWW